MGRNCLSKQALDSPLEVEFVFPAFESVVGDGAIGGAVGHGPHAVFEAAGAFNEMGEVLAGGGAAFVDQAFIAVQEDAAVFVALQDESFFFGLFGALLQEVRDFHTGGFGYTLDVAVDQFGRCDAAAVGALQAIDLGFDVLRDGLEAPLHIGMPLHVLPQPLVFFDA